MDASEHIQTARDFLVRSEQEFDAGERLQASEKLWGAVAHAILAVAQQRGWQFGSHHDLVQAARNISAELADTSVYDRFRRTRRLHANYYQGFLGDPELAELRTNAHIFVHRILSVAE